MPEDRAPDALERLHARLESGETVLGGWLHLPGGVGAEAMGLAGYDALTVDLQHGLIGEGGLVPTLQAIAATPAAPLVRVSALNPPEIMRALDAGAVGIICPMIDTPEQARALVHACRYPPHGGRSYGPTRARLLYGEDYLERAERQLLILAMIETALALENLEAILETPGLGGVFVGPGDLSLSLTGRASLDFSGGVVRAAVERVALEATRRGRVAGIFTQGGALARLALSLGYRLIVAGSDLALLTGAARAVVGELRGEAARAPGTPVY